jgi:hypothetical protein
VSNGNKLHNAHKLNSWVVNYFCNHHRKNLASSLRVQVSDPILKKMCKTCWRGRREGKGTAHLYGRYWLPTMFVKITKILVSLLYWYWMWNKIWKQFKVFFIIELFLPIFQIKACYSSTSLFSSWYINNRNVFAWIQILFLLKCNFLHP